MMGNFKIKNYIPSPPGATIADILEERGLSETEFSELIGWNITITKRLINGHRRIRFSDAVKLNRVFGGSITFWLIRESQYRDALEHQKSNTAKDKVNP